MITGNHIEDYLISIGAVIKELQEKHNISQTEMVEICKQQGVKISQSTISAAINGKGNLRFSTLLAIVSIFDIEIKDFFSMVENSVAKKSARSFTSLRSSKTIISNPFDSAFSGFLGKYYTYFYRTTGNVKELVRGELTFEPSEDGKKCIAYLKVKTGNIDPLENRNKEIEKEYMGEIVISQIMRAAYVSLFNEKAGELCMLTFRHWYIISSSLKCAMACAITTSSGANKLPTIHRMCLSRVKISPPKMEYVKGQLLMNDSNIVLTENQIKELLNDKNIPYSFKELLNQCSQKDKCVYIQETALYDKVLSEAEQIKWISYTRAHSSTPKYNKISRRTEESLFSLLEKDDDIVE